MFNYEIWFDEAFSFFIANQNLGDLLRAILFDNHPPFYFLFLHYWIKVFGNNELVLRIPSILFGLATIILFHSILEKLFDKKTATRGALLLGLMPFMIYFSVQVRMYSLFLFLTLLSTVIWKRLLTNFNIKNSILFMLVYYLAISTHYYGYLLVIPCLIMISLQRQRLKYFLVLFIPLTITLPWVYLYLTSSHPGTFTQNNLIALPGVFVSFIIDFVTLIKIFSSSGLDEIKILIMFLLGISMLIFIRGLVIRGTYHIKINKGASTYIIIFLSPLIFLFFTNLLIPVFSVRPTLFLAPYFFIIFFYGLRTFPKRDSQKVYLLIVSLVVLLNIFLLRNSDLKDAGIKSALSILSEEATIYHTSILTYYPFLYYDEEKKHILTTKNPLSSVTTGVIGGKTEMLPENLTKFVLVDIKNGADQKEVNDLLLKIKRDYKQKQFVKTGDITIYYFYH